MTSLPHPSHRRQTRLPVGPLLATWPPGTPLGDIADDLGIGVRHLFVWLSDGVPFYSADRAAISRRLHPVAVWPDWFTTPDYDDEV